MSVTAKMAARHTFKTDHPDVFEVIGSDGHTRYPVVLLRWEDPPRAACACSAGQHSTPCWHGALVIERRFTRR